MRMKLLAAAALLALAGCQSGGLLSPTAQQDIANAKANVCPSLQAVQDSLALNGVTLKPRQQVVVNELNVACNGPNPTSVAALVGYGANVAIVLAQIGGKK